MPIVFRNGGLRYYFFSNEGRPREPRHVHVKGGGKDVKIWLGTGSHARGELAPTLPSPARGGGLGGGELARILRHVLERRALILKAWDDHFGNGRPL